MKYLLQYSEEYMFEQESQGSSSIERAFQRALNPEGLSVEERAQATLELDMWLQGMTENPPQLEHLRTPEQRFLFIEQQMVRQERAEMKAEGREVLSPALKETLNWLAERLNNPSTRRMVLLHGAPGTGKSVFAEMLAQRVSPTGARVETVAEPLHPTSELISKPLTEKKELFSAKVVGMLEEISQEPDPTEKAEHVQRLLHLILEKTVNVFLANVSNENKLIPIYMKQLETMGVLSPQSSEEAPSSIKQLLSYVIESNGGADAVLDRLTDHWKITKQEDTLQGAERIDIGLGAIAAKFGIPLIVNEADKATLRTGGENVLAFGHGAEDLLEPKPGKVIRRNGFHVTIQEGYNVIVTANNMDKIADNIYRRAYNIQFESNLADLAFQARVLFADEDGQSLLEGRGQDERDLVKLMLWWEALGRHRFVAFNVNILNQLSVLMIQNGKSFGQAIQEIKAAYPEIQPFITENLNKGKKTLGTTNSGVFDDFLGESETTQGDQENLTLAHLNWMANARYLGGTESLNKKVETRTQPEEAAPGKVSVEIDETSQALTLQTRGSYSEVTQDYQTDQVANYTLSELLPNTNTAAVEMVSHSSLGQSAILRTEQGVVAVDTASGSKMGIREFFTNDKDEGHYRNWEKTKNIQQVFWISEKKGVFLVKNAQGSYSLTPFTKELEAASENSALWSPTLTVQEETTVLIPEGVESSAEPMISHDKGVVLISWQRDGQTQGQSLVLYNSETNPPFSQKALKRDQELELKPGSLGTFAYRKGTNNALWLKTT
jgi:hypothetical protein